MAQNLNTLDENQSEDKKGVFYILGIYENFASFDPKLVETLANTTNILEWLIKRVDLNIVDSNSIVFDSNRQYSSEILAIFLQNSNDIRLKFIELKGVETLLQIISRYRKKDPYDNEEIEFMENIFGCLYSLL